MFYQMTFAIITVALVAGAVADRMRFSAFLWFAGGWLIFVYVPIAHWVWGGGFLAKAGVLDFAGGTVVHLNAGIAGLVAAYVLGKRHGYGTDNFAPYDLSLAVIGTGLLWVGWLGFNGGSALGANARAAFAITATHLAASTGALTWMFLEWWTRGKPSVLGMISGAIAGLGTITPASGFVLPWHGVVIGLIAGAICFWACTWLKLRIGYDDSLDVFGVHGVGGATGTLLTGVFAVAALSASPDSAGGIAGTAGGQCPTGADPALRHRRGPDLVRRADLRAAQGDRIPGAAAGEPAARDRRSRRDPARRSVAIGRPNRRRCRRRRHRSLPRPSACRRGGRARAFGRLRPWHGHLGPLCPIKNYAALSGLCAALATRPRHPPGLSANAFCFHALSGRRGELARSLIRGSRIAACGRVFARQRATKAAPQPAPRRNGA